MRNPLFWILLVVASSAVALWDTWQEGAHEGDLLVEVIPLILGKTTGLVLIPVIVVSVVILIGKMFNAVASQIIIFSVVVISWLIMVASNISVSTDEFAQGSLIYLFDPKGCEYAVKFPESPNLYSTEIQNTEGTMVSLKGAQLTGDKALLRAECGMNVVPSRSPPSEKQVIDYMKVIASRLGLQRPAYEYRKDDYEAVGTITGRKDSERGLLTFRVINYVGRKSTMTLYIGSRSTDFMTSKMRRFVGSIRQSGR